MPKSTSQCNSVTKLILGAEVHRLVPELFRAEVTRAEHRLPRINRVNIVRHMNLVPKSTVDSTLRGFRVKQRNFVFLIFFQSTDVSKGRSHSCRTSIAKNKPYLQFYFLICSDITSPFLDFSWTLSGSATKFRRWYRRFYALTHWAWSFLVLYWLRNSSCFFTLSCTGFRTYLCIVLIIST